MQNVYFMTTRHLIQEMHCIHEKVYQVFTKDKTKNKLLYLTFVTLSREAALIQKWTICIQIFSTSHIQSIKSVHFCSCFIYTYLWSQRKKKHVQALIFSSVGDCPHLKYNQGARSLQNILDSLGLCSKKIFGSSSRIFCTVNKIHVFKRLPW